MAFISDEHKFGFIHIPKNAGTTVSDVLTRAHGSELINRHMYAHDGIGCGVPIKYRPGGIQVHNTYKDVIRKHQAAKDYDFFCVVSNPWERVFSFYQHKKRRGDKDLPSGSFSEIFRKSNVLILQPQLLYVKGCKNIMFLDKHGLDDQLNMFLYMHGIEMPEIERLNVDNEKLNYRDHYDEYAKDLIEEYYRYEIEYFGYEF